MKTTVEMIESGDIQALIRALNDGLQVDSSQDSYVDSPSKGLYTLLNRATQNNKNDMVELLVMRGADVEAVSPLDPTLSRPLHVASMTQNNVALKLLLKQKAGVNTKMLLNSTPMCFAALGGNIEAVTLLLEHKADLTIPDSTGKTILERDTLEPEIRQLIETTIAKPK